MWGKSSGKITGNKVSSSTHQNSKVNPKDIRQGKEKGAENVKDTRNIAKYDLQDKVNNNNYNKKNK